MKKRYLICVLMLVLMNMLMLCGCTAAVSDAVPEGAQPGLPAADSAPVSSGSTDTTPAGTESMGTEPADAAQAGRDVPWTDYGVGDGPTAPEETQYGRALDREELQALWARLEGKWVLSDLQAWRQSNEFAYPVYEFCPMEYGGCRLLEYSALGSGAYEWDWTVVREQNGVYTVRVSSESCEMTLYDCHQDSGTLFTLQFVEDGILLARSRPTRFEYWETQPTEGNGVIMVTRLATKEECELLANEGDEYGQLRIYDAGFQIIAGYEQPTQEYRFVTDEELEQLMQETDE